VQSLHVMSTGQVVQQGQPLLDLYSPELYQSEQEFLIERGASDTTTMHHGGAAESMTHEAGAYQASRQRLRLLGVPDDEVRRLEASGTASTRLTLRSPVSGTVLERGVTEGQYVSADTPLFTVADLSRIWVLADLYEMDLARVALGSPATFRADGLPARSFRGRVEFVYPTVSNETRTLKVRVSVANPGGVLRPGMYGQVSISGGGPSRLSIPTEAVVNTGEHRYVFLARAGGRFEPRQIEVGRESGDHIEVLSGVAEGDTVVASASFLIDSESRLKAAIEGMGESPAPGHSHGGRP
jgi:RND family efflux transporter MFP subunit